MERLIIYDADQLDCGPLYLLANEGRQLVVGERHYALAPDTADATATIATVFVTSRVDRTVLSRMPQLKLLVTLSTGTDHIDLKECARRSVVVCSVPSYGATSVAEYTLGLMLSLSRRLVETSQRLRDGVAAHSDLVGFDLAGKTLVVIGTGAIGQAVIKRAKAFDMSVIGVDTQPSKTAAKELGFRYLGLHEALKRADIISLHAPLTDETKHLINRNTLALLKPGAWLVNTARGQLVDTTALLHSLHISHLGGAALDVIENEALLGGKAQAEVLDDGSVRHTVIRDIAEHEALLKLPNVILTNHNAYNTREAHQRLTDTGVAIIRSTLAGRALYRVI